MEHTIRVQMFSAAAMVAAAIVVSVVTSTVVASRAYQNRAVQTARAQQELTVKGSARARVVSDLAVWHIHVTGDGKDLKAAYDVLEFGVDRVQAFLHEQGFGEADLALRAINTNTRLSRDAQGRETHEIAGFSLDRTFVITTADVNRVAHAAGEVTQLLKEAVRVHSFVPAYSYTKISDMKLQILGDASKDARSRANEIARNAGCTVGEVRKATMGVIQITQPHSTEVTSYGVYDTSTIEKDISVVVTVTFTIA